MVTSIKGPQLTSVSIFISTYIHKLLQSCAALCVRRTKTLSSGQHLRHQRPSLPQLTWQHRGMRAFHYNSFSKKLFNLQFFRRIKKKTLLWKFHAWLVLFVQGGGEKHTLYIIDLRGSLGTTRTWKMVHNPNTKTVKQKGEKMLPPNEGTLHKCSFSLTILSKGRMGLPKRMNFRKNSKGGVGHFQFKNLYCRFLPL